MQLGSIFHSGITGINSGINTAKQSANAIARHNISNKEGTLTDLAAHLIDLRISQTSISASANVISSVDEMLGTLLDVRA